VVYERLRKEILNARLLPGEKLNISQLSKRFAVSLAAVRESLSRLAADGLVDAFDHRGFRVSSVSVEDLRDLTRTRIDIEGLALRRSIENGDGHWLLSVKEAFEAMDALPYSDPSEGLMHNEAWIKAHRDFHLTLVRACDSQWLLHFREILYERSERYRRLSIPLDYTKRDIRSEHQRIVEAVLRRDVDAAIEAMAEHFTTTMHHALQHKPVFSGHADELRPVRAGSATTASASSVQR
jgi:DNA-binding GntR family transcriptional regulator